MEMKKDEFFKRAIDAKTEEDAEVLWDELLYQCPLCHVRLDTYLPNLQDHHFDGHTGRWCHMECYNKLHPIIKEEDNIEYRL